MIKDDDLFRKFNDIWSQLKFKSVSVLRNNLIANSSVIKIFLKQNKFL